MFSQRAFAAIVASLLAMPALAQTTSAPLNLSVPPNDVPAAASTAAPPHAAPGAYYAGGNRHADTAAQPGAPARASSTASPPAHAAPGVYYGDTSGRIYTAAATPRRPVCDDSTYNQTQMHGSATMGVAGGSHFGGSWGGATVNLSKAFGSCEHPTGGVSITISGANGNFHGH